MAYNKYYLQKRQVSYDNGLTWEDVTPSETRQGAFIDSYETLAECEAIPYSEQYLTIESLEDNNTIYWKASDSSIAKTISASTDNGSTWTAYTSSTGGTTIAILNAGDKLLLKGENEAYLNSYANYFKTTGQFEVYGNIMSLVSGDSFENVTSVAPYAFQALFAGCTGLIFAKNLILPAINLGNSCYEEMFRGCSYLRTAPKLPATTLAMSCYRAMFQSCTSLTTASELPATTLVNSCYMYMFNGCTSLNSITCLATDISASNCTYGWVIGVASSGTFTKAASMLNWTTGNNGIPDGWIVQNNS